MVRFPLLNAAPGGAMRTAPKDIGRVNAGREPERRAVLMSAETRDQTFAVSVATGPLQRLGRVPTPVRARRPLLRLHRALPLPAVRAVERALLDRWR
jgi:hypothetical protein